MNITMKNKAIKPIVLAAFLAGFSLQSGHAQKADFSGFTDLQNFIAGAGNEEIALPEMTLKYGPAELKGTLSIKKGSDGGGKAVKFRAPFKNGNAQQFMEIPLPGFNSENISVEFWFKSKTPSAGLMTLTGDNIAMKWSAPHYRSGEFGIGGIDNYYRTKLFLGSNLNAPRVESWVGQFPGGGHDDRILAKVHQTDGEWWKKDGPHRQNLNDGMWHHVAFVQDSRGYSMDTVTKPYGTNVKAFPAHTESTSEKAVYAFDNNYASKYFNSYAAGSGLTVSPGPSLVNGITLVSANDMPHRDPHHWHLEGANSLNGPWNKLIVIHGPAGKNLFQHQRLLGKTWTFSNTTKYSHYKWTVTKNYSPEGGGANYMQIAEIKLIGQKDARASTSVYIDGVLQAQERNPAYGVQPSVVNKSPRSVILGMASAGLAANSGTRHSNFMDGTIDEVRIWKRLLDSAAIKKNLNQQINTYDSNATKDLYAYLKMDKIHKGYVSSVPDTTYFSDEMSNTHGILKGRDGNKHLAFTKYAYGSYRPTQWMGGDLKHESLVSSGAPLGQGTTVEVASAGSLGSGPFLLTYDMAFQDAKLDKLIMGIDWTASEKGGVKLGNGLVLYSFAGGAEDLTSNNVLIVAQTSIGFGLKKFYNPFLGEDVALARADGEIKVGLADGSFRGSMTGFLMGFKTQQVTFWLIPGDKVGYETKWEMFDKILRSSTHLNYQYKSANKELSGGVHAGIYTPSSWSWPVSNKRIAGASFVGTWGVDDSYVHLDSNFTCIVSVDADYYHFGDRPLPAWLNNHWKNYFHKRGWNPKAHWVTYDAGGPFWDVLKFAEAPHFEDKPGGYTREEAIELFYADKPTFDTVDELMESYYSQFQDWQKPLYHMTKEPETGGLLVIGSNFEAFSRYSSWEQGREIKKQGPEAAVELKLTDAHEGLPAVFRLNYEKDLDVSPEVVLTLPDGTELNANEGGLPNGYGNVPGSSESNLPAREVVIALMEPAVGTYKLTIKDTTPLGEYTVNGHVINSTTPIETMMVASEVPNKAGTVEKGMFGIDWIGGESGHPDTMVSFFLDTDNKFPNGILAAEKRMDEFEEEGTFTFPTDHLGLQPDWYYVYMEIKDPLAGPVTMWSNTKIWVDVDSAPAPIETFSATPIDGGFEITWNDDKNTDEEVDYYVLQFGAVTGEEIIYDQEVAFVGETSRAIKGLENGRPYLVSVSAINKEGLISGKKVLHRVVPRASEGLSKPVFLSKAWETATVTWDYYYQPTVFDRDTQTDTRFEDQLKGKIDYKWSLLEAPKGMTVNEETGLVNWVPTRDQLYMEANVTLAVTKSGKEAIVEDNGVTFDLLHTDVTATQSFKVEVDTFPLDENNAGINSMPYLTARPGTTYEYQLTFNEHVGDGELYVEMLEGPLLMDVDGTKLVWEVPADVKYSEPVKVLVETEDGRQFIQEFFLSVHGENLAGTILPELIGAQNEGENVKLLFVGNKGKIYDLQVTNALQGEATAWRSVRSYELNANEFNIHVEPRDDAKNAFYRLQEIGD